MITTETIFELEPPLAILTFNRPEARNAMTWAMYDALVEACDRADRDDSVRVLILRGAGGKAFAAGTDISQFQQFKTPQDGVDYEQHIAEVLDRLERVAKPTLAQIEGVAVGAGCAIAVACDLRVATPESTFGIPIARTLGNCVTGAAFSRLVDLIGPGHAKDVLFTGRLVGADEAHAIGLVDRIARADAIGAAVRELAAQIASNAPLTIRATKEMTRRLLAQRRLSSSEARDLIEMCYGSADFKEGVAAFLAKRPPKWTGQ
ncbi:MAG: enoyl-CoA hydratase/isomerase family protein [Acidobacteria bacterium]|nr:enoyl-CoA hydratase/isomerase family protein [Acidobacteriota bacterium]